MKLSINFAMFHAKETKHINCAVGNIFADATVVYRKDTGCHFPSLNTHSAVMCVRSLARNGRRQPFLCLLNFISEMPKNDEIKVAANNSNRNYASGHDTATSIASVNLTCTNPYSIPTFEDYIAEVKRRFAIEKKCKKSGIQLHLVERHSA